MNDILQSVNTRGLQLWTPPASPSNDNHSTVLKDLEDVFFPSILVPHQSHPLHQIGIDIGGSLIKVVWFEPSESSNKNSIFFNLIP